ncbi:MAG: FKBP-type peptidyl-prolyl cis-trans isomerase [Rhodospirillaceae bacterium]|nr:MAG: FKBP-type peptidyl-prolyl cis-trans isomerase [Rhodospirillaceae bacterium]
MKLWLIVGAVVVVVVAVIFVALRDRHEDEPSATPAQAEVPTAPPATDYASIQAAYLDDNIKKPGWKATGSGLQYTVIKAADESSPKPAPGSVVTVNYEGRLIDGTVFDSSYARNQPISFPLNGVIAGWQEGVPMMRVGEIWEFAIPAGLAYGADTAGPIPGGSTLIFKIELLEAKTPVQ